MTKKQKWLIELASKAYGKGNWQYRSSSSHMCPNWVGDHNRDIHLAFFSDCGGFGFKPKYRRLKFFYWLEQDKAKAFAKVLERVLQEQNIEARVHTYKLRHPNWAIQSDQYAVSVTGLEQYPWNY